MKILGYILLGILVLVGIFLLTLIVPSAAYLFLLLYGIHISFWKLYFSFLLFTIVMNWFTGFFKRGNDNE